MKAPRMTPSLLPWPPSTTAHKNNMELMTLKPVGTTNCTCPAYSAPESPPMEAPITNAHNLNLKVGTPMISAASSSSRMATHARPTLLRSRLPTMMRTMTMNTLPAQNHQTPELTRPPVLPAEKTPFGSEAVSPTWG